MLIDSHVHLNDGLLYDRRDEIIRDAAAAGVTHCVCIGYDRFFSERAIAIAHEYENIYAVIGFHPSDIDKVTDADLEWLRDRARDERVVAIGEIGLDYYWDKSYAEKQREMFQKQIAIANDLKLPIVVHMREAALDTYQIIKNHKRQDLKGVMHCYSGSVEQMRLYLGLNMRISLAGPVTFKNARVSREVAREIPLSRLLIETDAPYLAPHPFRGKQNEPKHLPLIAREIAIIRDQSLEEIARSTAENTRELFGF